MKVLADRFVLRHYAEAIVDEDYREHLLWKDNWWSVALFNEKPQFSFQNMLMYLFNLLWGWIYFFLLYIFEDGCLMSVAKYFIEKKSSSPFLQRCNLLSPVGIPTSFGSPKRRYGVFLRNTRIEPPTPVPQWNSIHKNILILFSGTWVIATEYWFNTSNIY